MFDELSHLVDRVPVHRNHSRLFVSGTILGPVAALNVSLVWLVPVVAGKPMPTVPVRIPLMLAQASCATYPVGIERGHSWKRRSDRPAIWNRIIKPIAMARKKKTLILAEPVRDRLRSYKVRLDARTVITLGNLDALAFWKKRYPLAVIIR